MTRPVQALMWLLHWLPFSLLGRLGTLLGHLLYLFALERRRVGRINLSLCLPELDQRARDRLLRAHFVEMARTLLEYGYCWYATPEQMKRLVRIEGLHHLEAQAGHPVILLGAHFTGLEMAGIRLSIDVPMADIYTRQKNRSLDALIHEKRLRFQQNGRLISRQDGIRPVLRALKEGFRLYYLPDQDLGPKESVFVPFFGVEAATITGLPRLARASGAAVLPCFVRREADGYVLEIEAPLTDFPSDDPVADTIGMNSLIEAKVRARPAQYFWLHKRFKTRPEGEARFY
ncbi:lysophospholipid acyltransferase family protein [Chitinimonas lacunae]|uniref:Lysophospholipid acyltransferase family protein n=1 Tax=Chitinimonas lacunae TaxID=1963018 RepID=A0ABV8MSF1_9NEIS